MSPGAEHSTPEVITDEFYYSNHSCDPNCKTQIIVDKGTKKIGIFALKEIERGEELAYDYKFPVEDTADKIACKCASFVFSLFRLLGTDLSRRRSDKVQGIHELVLREKLTTAAAAVIIN